MLLRRFDVTDSTYGRCSISGASPRSFGCGEEGSRLGGRIQASQNHVPPNSDLCSVFAHFILEILENPKILTNIQKL